MRPLYSLLQLVGCIYCLYACQKEPAPLPPTEQVPFRTVMAYVAANNSLNDEAYENINQMEESIGAVDGNLIVYACLKGLNPALYRISADHSPEIKSQKVKQYLPHNSSDPAVMKQVLQDIKELYPAESYGLILWSHATGWIPPGQGAVKVKSFGNDNGSTMDIKDLKDALPNQLDFILFDACSMASVEVLYEIRDKAKYFISSPGEVIANGMPYRVLTNDLFSSDPQTYQVIAKKYYDHYNQQSDLMRSATISIVDGRQLSTLAEASKQLLTTFQSPYVDFKRSAIQRMDFDRIGNPLIAFDYEDFIVSNFGSISSQTLTKQLTKTILFKANTPFFNGIEIKTNCGISCYIPNPENEGPLHTYYRTLAWYKAGGFDRLF